MFEATTILGYKGEYNGKKCAIIGGDGQVTFGNCVLKNNATKIRTLYNGEILLAFLICLSAFWRGVRAIWCGVY